MRRLKQERVMVLSINYLVGAIALCKKNDNINQPYYIKVEYVKKEWHSSINYKNDRQFILNMLG